MVSLKFTPPDTPDTQISVIVPVRNGARYLREAIESILAQTMPPLEVLVMNDASEDETEEIAMSFGSVVRHVRLKQCGAAAARNRGVEEARGEFLSFLDSDDLWLPEKTQRQMDCLVKQSASSVAFCHMEQFISPELQNLTILDREKVMPGYSSCTMLIRTELFKSVGPFPESLSAGEFIEWFSRAKDKGIEPIMLDEILAKRRVHRSNHGLTNDGRQDYLRIAKMLIDKKRAQEAASVRNE